MGWTQLDHPFMVRNHIHSLPLPHLFRGIKRGPEAYKATEQQCSGQPLVLILSSGNSSSSGFLTMGFRLRPTSSCTRASSLRNLQVLLSLLLIALAPLAVGKRKRNSGKEGGERLLPFILYSEACGADGGAWVHAQRLYQCF